MIWKTWEIFLFVDAAYCSVKRFPLFNLRKGKSRWVLLDVFIDVWFVLPLFVILSHRFAWFDYKDHEDVGNLNDFIVIQEEVVLGSIMTQLFCLVIFFPTSSHQIPTCRGGGGATDWCMFLWQRQGGLHVGPGDRSCCQTR